MITVAFTFLHYSSLILQYCTVIALHFPVTYRTLVGSYCEFYSNVARDRQIYIQKVTCNKYRICGRPMYPQLQHLPTNDHRNVLVALTVMCCF